VKDSDGRELDPQTWVDEHGDLLYRYAHTRLRDAAAAEDAVQEAFLGALKARDRFAAGTSVRAWLMGILKHKIVDHLRRSARQVQMSDEDATALLDSPLMRWSGIPAINPPRWKFSPRRALEQKEFWGVFQSCLGKLQELQHTAFVLKEVDGQTTEEICKELDISPNYLWVLIHRSREQLKKCLEMNWTRETRAD
jgi:RNA polymerase sigma-70 factor (TIGR02943 family)